MPPNLALLTGESDRFNGMAQRINNLLINGLENTLLHGDAQERRRALVKLSRQPRCTRVIRIFKTVMLNDEDSELQYAARRLFNDWQPDLKASVPELGPIFIEGSFDEEEAKTIFDSGRQWDKLELIKKLLEEGDEEALPFIATALEAEEDRFVIASLVKALGSLGDETTIRSIQPYLKHEDSRVRANAVEALEMIGDEVIWPVLVPLLEDEDHRVRGNVAKTLYGFDGDEAQKLVNQLGESDREGRRDSALYFLKTVKPPWAEDLLFKIIPGEQAVDLLKKECLLLAMLGTERSVSYLGRELEKAEGFRQELFERALQELRANLELSDERFFELKVDRKDLPPPLAGDVPLDFEEIWGVQPGGPRAPAGTPSMVQREVWRTADPLDHSSWGQQNSTSIAASFFGPMVVVVLFLVVVAYSALGGSEEVAHPKRRVVARRSTNRGKKKVSKLTAEEVAKRRKQMDIERRRRATRLRERQRKMNKVRRRTMSVGRKRRRRQR